MRSNERVGRLGRAGLPLAWAGALLLLGGCEGMIALTRPDPVVKPKFDLTRAPLLVLVEEADGASPQPLIRYNLVRRLDTELRDKKVNRQLVPQQEVRRAQRDRPASGAWPPAELGRLLRAEQVLHVVMDPYVVPQEAIDPTARTKLSARVRVFDVASGDQLWPVERRGYPATFELPVQQIHSADPGSDLQETLAEGLADRVAKLFYKHKVSEREAFRLGAEEGSLP